MKTLVVFSHLRWNFVYQRPQHLLSRLAHRWPVIYVEEPVTGAADDFLEPIAAAQGVEVWRPHLRGERPGFHPENHEALRELVTQALRERAIADYWLWFYTPMALPLTQRLAPDGVVYDCMDELSAFRGAPPELVAQEAALFELADVVFTGGRSLYNAKRQRHRNVHCFSSSVDAQHFRQATQDHPLQASLPHPRLGYCGVIDERIDLGIIAGVAAARPDWHLVMVGPVAKIDPADLPQAPNIHWLGQQSYADLPAFISGWDVCLMPFALNESTRFISPTKTLEYMACGRPSISTAIRDVVDPYGHVVAIAHDAAGFVAAAQEMLQRTPAQQAQHAHALAAIIARTSWDATASAMAECIEEIDARLAADASLPGVQRAANAAPVGSSRATVAS